MSLKSNKSQNAEPLVASDVLERVLAKGRSTGAEFAEVYIEDKRSTSAGLDDGKVEQVTSGRDRGAGIRVVAGETTGFAHTSDLSERGLLAAAEAAAVAAKQGGGGVNKVQLGAELRHAVNTVKISPDSVEKSRKVELLKRADAAARSVNSAIVQVSAGYGDSLRRILVANSNGVLSADDQVRTLLRVSVVATGDGGMQTGYDSLGHTIGFELFDENDVEELAIRAAKQAVTKLSARPAPSGAMPVVIKRGSGGVLFHEACGHGLEADLVGKSASVYRDKMGELVASPLVTLIDDGTMTAEWGAIGIDDEGHPSQRNTLIQDGILTDYMWDYLRARKEGRVQSGNGRRQSYQHLPMVRMTNTFVINGKEDPDDIDTASGDFVFGMTEAYLIENGEITEPLRESNLIGNGPEVLKDIDLLGNDFAMGNPGMCGKDGQGVPVGDGQPTLRVRSLTIGGTAA
ncbi:MAG: TldD/PmbA family protein [Actinobacteria bacterium]|nr:TldD/PmbA family protein [Actinomycetota bacterium]